MAWHHVMKNKRQQHEQIVSAKSEACRNVNKSMKNDIKTAARIESVKRKIATSKRDMA